MVFLDRDVENNLAIIAAFCSIIYSIFCLSTMVFFQYFPVETSGECLDKDNQERSIFCYLKNVSGAIKHHPVDCADYSMFQLQELHFECYAVAIPGLGIAVAAALGLAKVGTASVTIFVRATAVFYKMTKKYSRKLEWCCHNGRNIVNLIYIASCLAALGIVAAITGYISTTLLSNANNSKDYLKPLIAFYYLAYVAMPILICFPMAYIIVKLADHCNQREYVSIAADQRPLDAIDWVIELESLPSITGEQQNEMVTTEQEPHDSNIHEDSESAVTERQQDESVTLPPAWEERDNRIRETANETEEIQP